MSIAKLNGITATPQRAHREGDPQAEAASVALVPVVLPQSLRPIAHSPTRPDPFFVTHLIAMAELSPQVRLLRRAAPEEAQAAYRSMADRNRAATIGIRLRQIA